MRTPGFSLARSSNSLSRVHQLHARIDGEYIGAGRNDADRRETLHRIERLLVEPWVDGVRHRYDEYRVTVGIGFRREIGADNAAGARAVIDKNLLAELFAELIGDDAKLDHRRYCRRRRRNGMISLIDRLGR